MTTRISRAIFVQARKFRRRSRCPRVWWLSRIRSTAMTRLGWTLSRKAFADRAASLEWIHKNVDRDVTRRGIFDMSSNCAADAMSLLSHFPKILKKAILEFYIFLLEPQHICSFHGVVILSSLPMHSNDIRNGLLMMNTQSVFPWFVRVDFPAVHLSCLLNLIRKRILCFFSICELCKKYQRLFKNQSLMNGSLNATVHYILV